MKNQYKLINQTAPLAKKFLEESAMMERLKASSPWLSEGYLRERLGEIVKLESREE